MELRGFEPLTSAVQASARLTVPPLPVLHGKHRRRAPPDAALERHRFTCLAQRQRLEGFAGRDENRWVVEVPLSAASNLKAHEGLESKWRPDGWQASRRGGNQAPRYAAFTCGFSSSSLPVPVNTRRPCSIT